MDRAAALAGHWQVLHERGAPERLHARSAEALNEEPVRRTVRFAGADRPALVLGSHQPADLFDPAAVEGAGLVLARRRSGGSAVLVGGERVLWVDFVIPAQDPLWQDDVSRAAWWVGDLWASAIPRAEVWRGPMRHTAWSRLVCFAGLGPGEVTLDGRKVVGVCQRRTRGGALFQTAALLRWDPDEYHRLVAAAVPAPAAELAMSARPLWPGARPQLETAILARLMP